MLRAMRCVLAYVKQKIQYGLYLTANIHSTAYTHQRNDDEERREFIKFSTSREIHVSFYVRWDLSKYKSRSSRETNG